MKDFNCKPILTVHEFIKYYLTLNTYFIIEDCENDYIYYAGDKRDFLNHGNDERELEILYGARIEAISYEHGLVAHDAIVIYI